MTFKKINYEVNHYVIISNNFFYPLEKKFCQNNLSDHALKSKYCINWLLNSLSWREDSSQNAIPPGSL